MRSPILKIITSHLKHHGLRCHTLMDSENTLYLADNNNKIVRPGIYITLDNDKVSIQPKMFTASIADPELLDKIVRHIECI